MGRVAYKNGGGSVGDGWRMTKVSNGGQEFAIMVDHKTMRTSEIELVNDEPTPAPQIGIMVQDVAELVATMPNAPLGSTFILSPGAYVFGYDPAWGHDFVALNGHRLKVSAG